jgi:hypothetical protein
MGAIAFWALLLGALLFQTVIVIARAWARSGLELAEPVVKNEVMRSEGGTEEVRTRRAEEAKWRGGEEASSEGMPRVEEAES